MAIELCSENSSLITSPARISFSYDLSLSDSDPIEPHLFRSNSSSGGDFDFCTHETWTQPSSSADELFCDGKILPTQIRKNPVPPKQTRQPETPSPLSDLVRCKDHEQEERLKETKGTISESEEKHSSKSFWRFKRSNSLNCGNGYGPSLCPLPLLSRSNSTGSATSQKQNSKKNQSVAASKPSSQHSLASGSYQKPPLKKSYGSYGGGVRVNPVLNVPSGNVFGLGSIFRKEKSKRK